MSSSTSTPVIDEPMLAIARERVGKVLKSLHLVPGCLYFWREKLEDDEFQQTLLDQFFAHANPRVIPLIAAASPPGIDELCTLGWQNVEDCVGDYLKVLVPIKSDLPSALYSGSASSLTRKTRNAPIGLVKRMQEHDADFHRANKTGLSDNAWNQLLKKNSTSYRFQPVWVWKRSVDISSEDDVTLARRQVIIYEALIAVSFGTFRTVRTDITKILCLWSWEEIEYKAGNRSFPLAEQWARVDEVTKVYTHEEIKERQRRRRSGEDIKDMLTPMEFFEWQNQSKADALVKHREKRAKRAPMTESQREANRVKMRLHGRLKAIEKKELETGLKLSEEEKKAILDAPPKKAGQTGPDGKLTAPQIAYAKKKLDPAAMARQREFDLKSRQKLKDLTAAKKKKAEDIRYETALRDQQTYEQNKSGGKEE